MKTLYMHMGTPKTGTTSLQEFLYLNRENLRKEGINYPYISGDKKIGNVQEIFLSENDDRKRAELISNAICQYADNCLISSEASWVLIEDFEIIFETIKRCGFEIKCIVYLRPQADYFNSFYNQYVKFEPCTYLDINEFMKNIYNESYIFSLMKSCHYYDRLVQIENIIGKDNLIIRIYEKTQMINGNIYEDFLDAINIKMKDTYVFPEKARNLSLDINMLELKRLINKAKRPIEITESFGMIIEKMVEERPVSKANFNSGSMSSQQRKNFMQQFEEENKRIALHFLDRKNEILFLEYKEFVPKVQVDDGILLRDLVECFAKISLKQQQEISKLEEKIIVLDKLQTIVKEQNKKFQEKERELEWIKNSKSWKITAPLRKIRIFILRDKQKRI